MKIRRAMKPQYERDLKKAIEELTAEYTKTIENDFIFKPMSFTLYHLWTEWDVKEHSRISNTER